MAADATDGPAADGAPVDAAPAGGAPPDGPTKQAPEGPAPVAADDGIERLRRWRDEDRGVPPAVGRVGARLVSVGRCTTTVRLPLVPELLLPDGVPTGAVTSLLADMGLTTSVISSLPDLRGVTTISMTVDHHALPPASGGLVATCTAAGHVEGRPQHASGLLHDDEGRLVATVCGWFLATPAEALAADRVGLVLEEPAAHLLDLLQVPGGTSFPLVARDALSNAISSLHGGIGALAAQLAAEAALDPASLPLTSAFFYLRPTPRHGAVQVTGEVVRQGRRTAVATSVLTGPDGRPLVTSTLVAALRA
ncbi:MAG: hypothetical protein JWN08_3695 [Frankiales bacterium]|nr:hypothetical protein [Frankiales bacterium]